MVMRASYKGNFGGDGTVLYLDRVVVVCLLCQNSSNCALNNGEFYVNFPLNKLDFKNIRQRWFTSMPGHGRLSTEYC